MSEIPYNRLPTKVVDGKTMIYAPGNLQAVVAIAKWQESGTDKDFWEWTKEQKERNDS